MIDQSRPDHSPSRAFPGTKASRVSLVVASGLAVVLLYYSLRGIDWREAWGIVTAAKPGGLIVAVSIGTLTLFLRAVRWRILLLSEGFVSIPATFWATAAGYFGNNFLPARAGELVRSFMISSRTTLQSGFVLATAVSDRVADSIALITICAVVLLTLPDRPGWLWDAARPVAVLGLIGALSIGFAPVLGPAVKTALERLPLPHIFRDKVSRFIDHGLRGLTTFHDARRLFAFVGLTTLIWCLDAAGAIVAARALGFQMSLSAALLLIAGLGLGSALPATPGYIGIYQFVAVTVLAPFGYSRTNAIAYMLVVQALSYIVIAGWGGLGLWRYRRT